MKIYKIALVGLVFSTAIVGCKKDDKNSAPAIKGCKDPASVNFNPDATVDDGSCSYVSTAAQNRVVVVEEYTGVRCTFCPDGHRRAQSFYDANPGKVILLNIHTGSFATAASGWPDFTTTWGAAMASKAGMGQSGTGYPGGSVSRNTFAGNATVAPYKMAKGDDWTLLNRGGWWDNGKSPAGDVIKNTPAPVNIGIKTTLDEATREVKIRVEVYVVNAIADGAKLNVAIAENNVVGKQIDMGSTKTAYVHNHMLRDLITGQWGEAIETGTAGNKVIKEYTYKVAEKDKNNAEIKLKDCVIVAYVTSTGNNDVFNGKEVKLK